MKSTFSDSAKWRPPTKTPPLCPVGDMALLLFESSHGLPTNRYLQLQRD
jgi:hypothetical protein